MEDSTLTKEMKRHCACGLNCQILQLYSKLLENGQVVLYRLHNDIHSDAHEVHIVYDGAGVGVVVALILSARHLDCEVWPYIFEK